MKKLWLLMVVGGLMSGIFADELTQINPVRPILVGMSGTSQVVGINPDDSMPLNALLELNLTVDEPRDLVAAKFTFTGLNPKIDLSNTRLLIKEQRKSFATTEIDGQTIIMDNQIIALKKGANKLFLKTTLAAHTDLDRRFSVQCDELIFADGAKITPTKTVGDQKLRCGIALRQRSEDNSLSYRIPGLETAKNGRLIAVYDNRYHHAGDLPADIDVGMQYSDDGGRTWTAMRNIMDFGDEHNKETKGNGVGDPTILYDAKNETIWVAALWSRFGWGNTGTGLEPKTTGQFALTKSTDNGRTWSPSYSITNEIKNPNWHIFFNGPGKGIVMRDGTIVFPAQFQDDSKHAEGKDKGKPRRVPWSTIVYSTDKGATWQVGTGAKERTSEAQVVELADGSLMLNMRDESRIKSRGVAITKDLGKTWTEHATSSGLGKNLVEPVCQASIIRARWKNGDQPGLLLFSNPNNDQKRVRMTIKFSKDEGDTWSRGLLLDDISGLYSCMTMIDDETIGILYETETLVLAFMRIPLQEVLDAK